MSVELVQETLKKRVAPKLPKKWRERALEGRSQSIDGMVRVLRGTFPEVNPEKGILIGLHADGATSAIVETAVKQRRSFVVVPCCVFRNLFEPSSKDAHADFCDHLQSTAKGIRRISLNFPGRNICLYKKHVEIDASILSAQKYNFP
ncbi:MAG: hypothetical protein AAGE99_06195, partial [Chlamydiota bacterium]